MRAFKTDNGDLVFNESMDLVMIEGPDELIQSTKTRLSINIGEWFLDLGLGLRYKDIQGKNVSDRDIELAIRDCVLQDERIKDVEIVEISRDTRFRCVNIDIKVIGFDGEKQYLREVVDIG